MQDKHVIRASETCNESTLMSNDKMQQVHAGSLFSTTFICPQQQAIHTKTNHHEKQDVHRSGCKQIRMLTTTCPHGSTVFATGADRKETFSDMMMLGSRGNNRPTAR
jgi:fructosamine-3-kinase